jgi:hydrogenase maturation protease
VGTSAAQNRGAILVLGLGNLLMGDEGLGVQAAARLQSGGWLRADGRRQQVQVIDGGTMGLDLLPYLEGAEGLLIVDAVRTGHPPGSVVRLEGEEIPALLALKLSLHQVALQEVLALSRLRGTLPSRVVLWGVVPSCVEWGVGLSPAVAAAMDALLEGVVAELRAWGDGGYAGGVLPGAVPVPCRIGPTVLE